MNNKGKKMDLKEISKLTMDLANKYTKEELMLIVKDLEWYIHRK